MSSHVNRLSSNELAMANIYRAPGLQTHYTNTSIPSGNTVVNTASETDFETTLSIPANILTEGQAYKIKAFGTVITSATPTLTLKIYYAGQVMLTLGPITFGFTITGQPWVVDADISCASEGISGTFYASGTFGYNDTGTLWVSGNRIYDPFVNTSSVTVNTFVDNEVKISATWSTASAGDSVTMRQIIAR